MSEQALRQPGIRVDGVYFTSPEAGEQKVIMG
jgi:hypothetical protein